MSRYKCSCGVNIVIRKEQEGYLQSCPKCRREFISPKTQWASEEVAEEIEIMIRAGYGLLYIVSPEESRVSGILDRIARKIGCAVRTWTCTEGFGNEPITEYGTRLAIRGLQLVQEAAGPQIFVFKDFHSYLRSSVDGSMVIVRKLRDVLQASRGQQKTIIILAPVVVLPEEVETSATVLEFPLPDFPELDDMVRFRIIDKIHNELKETKVDLNDAQNSELAQSLLGLTTEEAENALFKATIQDGTLGRDDISQILYEKGKIVKKSGTLEFIPPQDTLDAVGGLEHLKSWLLNKRQAFRADARQAGVDEPRGVLLAGVPGCGKSLTAKAISASWRMPLLRFDVGKVFAMYIGESENNMRRAIKLAESLAPCILWLDEIEKGFSGLSGSSSVDAGTTARVFSTFLTWMQERKRPVFIAATANNVRLLPPEFLRKGRFDEIFYVDLPRKDERREIFAIHLAKRRKDTRTFDLAGLAEATDGFTGADIEAAVKEAVERSFISDKECNSALVLETIKQIVPLSVTMREEIEFLREWCQTRARPASKRD